MINRYGMSWPDDASDVTMELGGYRLARDGFDTGKLAWEHMFDAAGILFPEDVYCRHPWVSRRMQIFCLHPWQTWIGPGSTAKSTDAAMCILLHWLSAPSETTCVVCSTTTAMLEKRIFGELVRYYSLIPNAPGEYRKSSTSIILGDENSKNGIFGIAVLKGTVREALGNMIGLHNTYVGLVIDEMQATRKAAVEAATNLSSSGKEFVFLGMGNPESRHDPLGRYSEPKDGWGDLHPDTCGEGWITKYGWCEFFDGYQCPSVIEPNGREKYPFLLSSDAIQETIEKYGVDSPQFWSQRRGFFPPEGIDRSLFSEGLLAHHYCHMPAKWETDPIPVAGLDPAFSAMGDRCAIQFGLAGRMLVGDPPDVKHGILLTDTVVVKLELKSDLPLTFRIADSVIKECKARGVRPSGLGMDCTGAQSGLADLIEERWEPGLYRVQFGGKASVLPAGGVPGEGERGKDYYANRVTELWHVFFRFCRAGVVRGMGSELARELCSRQLMERLRPVQIEPKTIMKSRTGASPDLADAAVVLSALVRERMGFDPEAGGAPLMVQNKKMLAQLDLTESEGDSYLSPIDFDSDTSYLGGDPTCYI